MEIMRRLSEVSPCKRCNKQPVMMEEMGKNQFRTECPPCQVRLWAMSTAQEALGDWEQLNYVEQTSDPQEQLA